MTQMQVEYAKYLESGRHNQATEMETNRSNLVNEGISRDTLAETIRHDKVGERETKRHNKAGETENKRHNKAGEKETKRHDLKSEKQVDFQNLENRRHNLATEQVGAKTVDETIRHNMATENQAVAELNESKRRTDVQSQTSIETAKIGAQGRIDSATIAANASKYATDINRAIQAYKTNVEKEIANDKNATEIQKNTATNETNKSIAAADRLAKAVQAADANGIARAKNELEKRKLELDRMYKRGELTLDYLNSATKTIDNWLKLGEGVGKFIK